MAGNWQPIDKATLTGRAFVVTHTDDAGVTLQEVLQDILCVRPDGHVRLLAISRGSGDVFMRAHERTGGSDDND